MARIDVSNGRLEIAMIYKPLNKPNVSGRPMAYLALEVVLEDGVKPKGATYVQLYAHTTFKRDEMCMTITMGRGQARRLLVHLVEALVDEQDDPT